jgi:hypothetical protein
LIEQVSSPQAPSPVNGTWIQGDGSLKAITKAIANGVPKPRSYPDPMPPKVRASL